MEVKITKEATDKLTHRCEEIRWRMLEQIESKFIRALKHQHAVVFNPSELCKQLIRWFNCETVSQSYLKVLNLIFQILKSPYGDEALKFLGVTFLRTELCKIEIQFPDKSEELDIIRKICDFLFEYENRDSMNSQPFATHNGCSLISELSSEDYEIVWSKPNEDDYDSLKYMAQVLSNVVCSSEEKVAVLQYLQVVMPDYPAEYMLQPPHIFANLIFMCRSSKEDDIIQTHVVASLLSFLEVLKRDLRKRLKVNNHVVKRKNAYGSTRNFSVDRTKTQIKIVRAMELLLEKCFDILDYQTMCISNVMLLGMETISEILEIVKLHQMYIPSKFFRRGDQLKRNLEKSLEKDVTRSKQIWLTFILIEMAEINAKSFQLGDQYTLFVPQLLDYSLYIHYSKLFERIKKVSFSGEVAVEQSYKNLQILTTHIERAIILLTHIHLEPSHVIEESSSILPIFDILKSMKLTKIVIDALIKASPHYLTDNQLKVKATNLWYNLIQLKSSNIKFLVYHSIAKIVKKYFGALMNNETVFEGIQNKRLLSALIIGLPFDTNMLQQMVYESYDTNSTELKKYAANIILLIIKSYHFYKTDFKPFGHVISPLFPILQCCNHFENINEILLNLLDPDLKFFSYIDWLRANVAFMFSNESKVRNEALARLVYMLSFMSQPTSYVPNVAGITNGLPNDIFILQTPLDLQHIFDFYESALYTQADLRNILSLLDTKDIEPLVRKSTLMQLNAMCKNVKVMKDFCEEQAHCLVLLALESALKKDSFNDYPENVIPTISILAKLLIFDCTFRHELAQIPNMYILLLRAVFNFPQEVQLLENTSICIFLLVFDCYIVVSPNIDHVVAPKVMQNLRVPLYCKFSSISQTLEFPYSIPNIQDFHSSDIEWKSYLRQVIAHSYLKFKKFTQNYEEPMLHDLDICPSLMIDHHDSQFTTLTNFFQNVESIIDSIKIVTDQKLLMKQINSLRLQLILFSLENESLAQIPVDLCNIICTMLSSYLNKIPQNEEDFQLYLCLLGIFRLCVRHRAMPIIQKLKNILLSDLHHSIIIMLKTFDLPLYIYFHLNDLMLSLLNTSSGESNHTDLIFRRQLFQYVHGLIIRLFESRHLHKLRCLLKLTKSLTSYKIGLPEQDIYKCSKSFIKLSIGLRSVTQTGAQLHRYCLLIFIQIFNRTSEEIKVNFPESFLKHMIGLCGHNDMEVRALAWICLSVIASIKTQCLLNFEGLYVNGSQLIQTQLDYLPGGFIACCLCTFLDVYEKILVRNFAGFLFIQILNGTSNFERAKQLLELQSFFSSAYNSLQSFLLENEFSPHNSIFKTPLEYPEEENNLEIATCETVICYCGIFITLIKLQSEFVEEICEKPLLYKLSELLKIPLKSNDIRHYEMCAQICHLFLRCSIDNFIFLQRTICRDEHWLSCLFDLLILPLEVTKEATLCVLQLSVVLCREDVVFRSLCKWLLKSGDSFRKFVSRVLAVEHIGSSLQRYLLALLINLLTKAQSGEISEIEKTNFIYFLEEECDITKDASNLYQPMISNFFKDSFKENKGLNINFSMTEPHHNNAQHNNDKKIDPDMKTSLSELVLLSLYKSFLSLHPCNSHNFFNPPSAVKIQVCEALSLLLKLSPLARLVAHNLRVLNTILLVMEHFFEQLKNSGENFIKPNGSKKIKVLKNFQVFFELFLHWFSPFSGVLVDEFQCIAVSNVISQSWAWVENSFELKLLVLKVCSFLSERSLKICIKFSEIISGSPLSILQVFTKLVVTETCKIKKKISSHLLTVATGLRVMMNCSACPEGRITLLKQNVLEIIETLLPTSSKALPIHLKLLHHWLEFWELFSRYDEGGNTRNLNSLCKVINQSTPNSKTRLLCLKILRNICFLQQNRSTVILSSSFRYTLDEVINQRVKIIKNDTISFEEQFITCVAIWKLISGGIKFVSTFRGTKLTHNLRILQKNLEILSHDDAFQNEKIPFAVDLYNVLDIILTIFG